MSDLNWMSFTENRRSAIVWTGKLILLTLLAEVHTFPNDRKTQFCILGMWTIEDHLVASNQGTRWYTPNLDPIWSWTVFESELLSTQMKCRFWISFIFHTRLSPISGSFYVESDQLNVGDQPMLKRQSNPIRHITQLCSINKCTHIYSNDERNCNKMM